MLENLSEEVNDSKLWNDPDKAKDLLIEKKSLEDSIDEYAYIIDGITEAHDMIEIIMEDDSEEAKEEADELEKRVELLKEKIEEIRI